MVSDSIAEQVLLHEEELGMKAREKDNKCLVLERAAPKLPVVSLAYTIDFGKYNELRLSIVWNSISLEVKKSIYSLPYKGQGKHVSAETLGPYVHEDRHVLVTPS